MSSMPEHPGKIVHVDGNTGDVIREQDAAEVPESIKFIEVDGEYVPVVKIVVNTYGNQRRITQYGADDRFLKETVQVRKPPPDGS